MAGNTGDEAKGTVTPAEPAGVSATPGPHEAGAVAPQSEWTVSDRRGPLFAAPNAPAAGDDVERIVPESEMDAAGVRDTPHPVDRPAGPDAQDGAPHDGDVSGGKVVGAGHARPVIEDVPLAGSTHADASAPADAPRETEPLRDTPDGRQPPAAPPAAMPPRRSPWPVAAGVVIGALVGAGSAALVYTQAPRVSAPAAAPDADTALAARVDALDKRPDPQPALAGLRNDLHDLAGKVAALERQPRPAAAPPQPATPAAAQSAGQDTAALDSRLAALQAEIVGLKGQNGKLDALGASVAGAQALVTAAQSNVDALKGRQQELDGRIGALQSGIDTVRGEQKALAGRVGAPALAVAADSLVGQVEGGKPFAAQVDALATLGADPAKLAVLRQGAAAGVPSAQVLLARFQPLADPVIATGAKAPATAGFAERLKQGLLGLVSIRRGDDTSGSDLASRVALIQADLAHNDVAGAYAAWSALPSDAKAKSDAWGALAKTSAEALAAARALQAESIGSLTAKRS